MSTTEHEGGQQEQRSSVKISMTAKGDATVEVKVYETVDATELERIRQLAVGAYNSTVGEVRRAA